MNIKVRKRICNILLIIALLPFLITLITGIYGAVTGVHDGICILCNRELIYGMDAFMQTIIFAAYIFWPVYVIAAIIILITIIILVNLKNKAKQVNL